MLTPAPIDIRPLELELHCTQLSFLKCASKQSPRKCFFWLFVHMYILTRRLFASGLLAPSGALMFILVYYIHIQPLLQIFQILQILKYLKDPTCGIFLKSKGFKDIKYDINNRNVDKYSCQRSSSHSPLYFKDIFSEQKDSHKNLRTGLFTQHCRLSICILGEFVKY